MRLHSAVEASFVHLVATIASHDYGSHTLLPNTSLDILCFVTKKREQA
jgi:hypothetical protein